MRIPTHNLKPLRRIGNHANPRKGKRGLSLSFSIDKRQKFVIAIAILTLGLFYGEYQFSNFVVIVGLVLAVFTVIFLWWAIHKDVTENKSFYIFILPFFYSLAFGLFYFLTPTVFIAHLLLAAVYAFGLYSLLLSQNILTVASIRTIQLLSGARIVSFVITLISFFLLSNIVFTLRVTIFPVIALFLLYTFPLIYHSLRTYSLQKGMQPTSIWATALTVCLVESATLLWFWPSSPTMIALFLTGFFYTIVGLTHIWFERRLFKGVLWEYVWVGCIVFFVLNLFTQWGK